jgi:hypothetical protein
VYILARVEARGGLLVSILPFFRYGIDFDDAATHVMGEAFEAACAELKKRQDIEARPRD